jgi:hypothetical protein
MTGAMWKSTAQADCLRRAERAALAFEAQQAVQKALFGDVASG